EVSKCYFDMRWLPAQFALFSKREAAGFLSATFSGHAHMIKTPYYLIDKQKLLGNLEKIAYVREQSGAKALLA
ncbi:MAG TPA: hypothetical protein DCX38_09755, partial [Pseudomonas sp.]|nr:hypothetical protein [Pseudomonas sp.]